jgi:hypothetical protein
MELFSLCICCQPLALVVSACSRLIFDNYGQIGSRRQRFVTEAIVNDLDIVCGIVAAWRNAWLWHVCDNHIVCKCGILAFAATRLQLPYDLPFATSHNYRCCDYAKTNIVAALPRYRVATITAGWGKLACIHTPTLNPPAQALPANKNATWQFIAPNCNDTKSNNYSQNSLSLCNNNCITHC